MRVRLERNANYDLKPLQRRRTLELSHALRAREAKSGRDTPCLNPKGRSPAFVAAELISMCVSIAREHVSAATAASPLSAAGRGTADRDEMIV